MNTWTTRQISGAILTSIGVFSLLVQPAVTGLVEGASQFLAALAQATLAVVGLGGTLIGVYRLGTKEKQPPAVDGNSLSAKSVAHAILGYKQIWITIGLVVVAVGVGIYKTSLDQARYANLTMTPPMVERQWNQIDSNSNGDALFIDPKSLIRNGDRVEYWNKVTFTAPRNVGSYLGAYAILGRSVADCRNRTISNVQSLAISKTGQAFNIAYTPKHEQVFVPVPSTPGHPDAILFAHVCTDKR